jgi:hypothetical protein
MVCVDSEMESIVIINIGVAGRIMDFVKVIDGEMMLKKASRARLAGKALAEAIVLMTDLFYQVDTRNNLMEGLIDSLKKAKKKMDKDRKERRK